MISTEIAKFWEYMVLIDDKIALVIMAQAKSQIVKEHSQKKPINKARNTINFMNQTSNTTLATLGVKDRFAIIIWAKRFLEKHNLLNKVLDKAKQMEEEVRQFKEVFKPLFDKGLPFFVWLFSFAGCYFSLLIWLFFSLSFRISASFRLT
jgi:hypothetical protein